LLACYKKRRKPAPPVTIYRDGREVCAPTKAGQKEYHRRREAMELRQRFKCAICNGVFLVMQFDHEAGRGSNAKHRDDRLLHEDGTWRNAALCPTCNTFKASKRFAWINGEYQPIFLSQNRSDQLSTHFEGT